MAANPDEINKIIKQDAKQVTIDKAYLLMVGFVFVFVFIFFI